MSSTTSSLVGYENNNDINRGKMKQPSKVTQKPTNTSSKRRARCVQIHFNSLWSLWYGVFGTLLQGYTAVKCIKRILGYSVLTWPESTPLPVVELNTSLGLTGAAILLLPFFLITAVFKIGNMANDGFKLGRQLSTCSREPPSESSSNSGACSLWKHGGPTAPFLHLVIGFSLLLPKLLMEARLIEAGLLPQESIWRTDLDFMVMHRDRLVVLSFMAPSSNSYSALKPSALPIITTPGHENVSLNDNIPSALPFTNNVVKTLREYIGHDNNEHLQNHHVHADASHWANSLSVEYLNFALALMVYAVRYPSIFWASNKCMGMLFSFQLLINGLQTLLAYAGMSILYKVQVIGPWKSLPLLKHQVRETGDNNVFLLNPQVTIALYILSCLLILASSLVLYLYGHTRFISFLNQERERNIIALKETGHSKWSYFTHCAALCVLISVGICNAPLLHDYTVVYKGSLDGAILACVVGGILHLFIWIVTWLFLTIKHKWIFKIRVTIGRATLRSARSIRLVTDVDLMSNNTINDQSTQPLLIVGNGRTYQIADTSPKKAIMSVIQKTTTATKKIKSDNSTGTNNTATNEEDDSEEQIYWLRPALVTPQSSPDGAKQFCCFKRPKHKVTFNEPPNTTNTRTKNNARRLPGMEVDDGDYATLRELPIPPITVPNSDDSASEEGKLLACVHDEHITYAGASQDLIPPLDYEDPSPLLTPEPLSDKEDTNVKRSSIAVVVHNNTQVGSSGLTPRCLRRADSGMPHDELTPRSESISTEGSTPPDPPGSNHSETSSGVHSNESSDNQHHFTNQNIQNAARRATSVANLAQANKEEVQWKSCSLQRNVLPPTSENFVTEQTNTAQFTSSTSAHAVYGYTQQFISSPNSIKSGDIVDHSIPAVILENPDDNTVVIRRKIIRPKTTDSIQTPIIKEEQFGRATNMRMTSFTENSDLKNIQSSSATLPHYPTQPVPVQTVYPHCSTMPLPQHTSNNITSLNNLGGGNSCNIYTRQHTTIPTHHNGVRLFNVTQNPYIKRLQHKDNNSLAKNGPEPIYTGINRASGEIYHYSS